MSAHSDDSDEAAAAMSRGGSAAAAEHDEAGGGIGVEGEAALRRLAARRVDDRPYLAAYLDFVGARPGAVLAAVGVDPAGNKRVLGVRGGGRNAERRGWAARDLVRDLVRRGFARARRPLFVTGGSAALRRAVAEVPGGEVIAQACRARWTREVLRVLPGRERPGAAKAIADAWRRGAEGGGGRLGELAAELERRGRGAAARRLQERPGDLFTVDRLGLHPQLRRSLSTTHVIAGVRLRPPGPTADGEDPWPDRAVALRHFAARFVQAEKGYRKIAGYRHLQLLKDHLDQIALPL